MDIGQVEAFLQVATQGSFSRAAETLRLTQPSVTARIQALERELGQALFERTGRGVRLTDAGHLFFPYAERLLQALHDGCDALAGLERTELGFLRIGTAPAIGTYVLPKLLRAFTAAHPGVEVSVRTGHSEQVLQMLLSDEVQVGLVRTLVQDEVETITLYEDEVVLATGPQHPFARSRRTTIAAVSREPLIFWDRESSYYTLIRGLLERAGVRPRTAMELDSVEATKKMVEEGLGIAFLPRVSVEREVRLGILRTVQVTDIPPVTRQIALILRRNRHRSGAVLAFVELLRSAYGFPWPAPQPPEPALPAAAGNPLAWPSSGDP